MPEDVREDVLEEMENQKDKEPVYRRPSTMIEKQQALAERLAIAKAMIDISAQILMKMILETKKPQKI